MLSSTGRLIILLVRDLEMERFMRYDSCGLQGFNVVVLAVLQYHLFASPGSRNNVQY